MPPLGRPIEIHPLSDQPSLRIGGLLTPRAADRRDLAVTEIPHDASRQLQPPTISLDEAGHQRPLATATPAKSACPLYFARLSDGVVAVPPATRRCYLLSGRGELVADSVDDSPNVYRRAVKDWARLAEIDAEPATNPREVMLVAGQRNGYWHWWVDILPRIWLLEACGPASTGAMPLVFPAFASQFQSESLDALGLSARVEHIAPGLSRFKSVTFTPGLTAGGSRFPSNRLYDYARWLRATLTPQGAAGGGPARRIFVSRADAASRRIANEAEIATLLQKHGFEVVECARMSVPEQIAAFADAAIVVGAHGAGLTNLLFSRAGTHVVEIFASTAAQEVSNYRVLASHLGLTYSRMLGTPVETTRRSKSPHDLDIKVDANHLARVLAVAED